ncbi:MAG: DUF4143 domain-containing protein [Nanoarchaeota archaeon]
MYLNYDHLTSDLKISKKTLLKHVFYLEFAYLLRKIRNFRSRQLTASKKLQRVYPYHWGLIFTINGENIYESFVASTIDAEYYWRDKDKEIDFIIIKRNKIIPIEVKSANVKKNDLNNLVYFCNKNKIREAFLIYDGEYTKEKIGSLTVTYLPFWKFALKPNLLIE